MKDPDVTCWHSQCGRRANVTDRSGRRFCKQHADRLRPDERHAASKRRAGGTARRVETGGASGRHTGRSGR